MTWCAARIRIVTRDGDATVAGWVSPRCPGLAIHRHTSWGFTVTHVRSGISLSPGLTDPVTVAERLAACGDWDRELAVIREDRAFRRAVDDVRKSVWADFARAAYLERAARSPNIRPIESF